MRGRSVCLLVVGLAACSSVEKGGAGLPQAVVAVDAQPVGKPSGLDASGSTDPSGTALTYAWAILSVPVGSTVTAPSSATDAKTTLLADRSGTYKVRLTITNAAGALNAAFVDVVVPEASVFYVASDITNGKTVITPNVVRADGSGGHAIGCPSQIALGSEYMGDSPPPVFALLATFTASQPTRDGRFVFPSLSLDMTAGYSTQLLLGGADTDCTARKPKQLDSAVAALVGSKTFSLFPRLSPNGMRVLYSAIDLTSSMAYLVTVSIDGSAARVVQTYAYSDGQLLAPAWIDDTTVAWGVLSKTVGGTVALFKASDASMAAATKIHDCTGIFIAIGGFAILPGDKVLLAGAVTHRSASPMGAMNLYDNSLGTCATTGALTNETDGHFAGDFSVSADNTKVLFAWDKGQVVSASSPLTDIYIAPIDGSAMPKRLAGDAALTDLGPRFLPGEGQVVWTQLPAFGNSPPDSSSIWVVNSDGSNAHSVLAAAAVSGEFHFVGTSGNITGGCSFGGATSSRAGLGWWLCVAVALAAWGSRRYSRL